MKVVSDRYIELLNYKIDKVFDDIKKELEADYLILQTSYEKMIQEILPKYFQWVIDGKPEYREKQIYYDQYHDSIEYNFKENMGEFNIQIYDSPDVDIWIKGKFRLEEGYVKIVEISSYRT